MFYFRVWTQLTSNNFILLFEENCNRYKLNLHSTLIETITHPPTTNKPSDAKTRDESDSSVY